jgi:flagellar basal body-associated protein FliL
MADEGAQAPAAPSAPTGATTAPAGGKKNKWLWIGIAAAAVVVIAVACILVFVVFSDDIFGGGSGPEQTIQEMFDAMAAKDVDGFIDIMDPQGLEMVTAAGLTIDDFKAMLQEEMTYESMEFKNVKLESEVAADGQTATVTVVEGQMVTVENGETTTEDVKDSEEAQQYQLVLRDGKWYLDISSMM